MRRGSTPCWIDKNGNFVELNRIHFRDTQVVEDYLQNALHTAPNLLPVSEIDYSFTPIVSLGREIEAIDNLFITPMGRIILVETKLWRNPQEIREVIAQILDYAVRMSTWSYDDLQKKASSALKPTPIGERTLYEMVKSAFPNDTPIESEFVDKVSRTLKRGRFMLLVVGDGIRESLENMVGVLHQYPQMQFTFGLVELQLFEHPSAPDGRLIVPQILLNTQEVVRAVVKVQAEGRANVSVELEKESDTQAQGYQRRRLTEEEFLEEIENEIDKRVFKELIAYSNQIDAKLEWRSASVSVRIKDPAGTKQMLTLFVMTSNGTIYTGWLANQLKAINVDPQIAIDFVKSIADLFPDTKPHENEPSSLSRQLKAQEVAESFDAFCAVVSRTVEQIRAGWC